MPQISAHIVIGLILLVAFLNLLLAYLAYYHQMSGFSAAIGSSAIIGLCLLLLCTTKGK